MRRPALLLAALLALSSGPAWSQQRGAICGGRLHVTGVEMRDQGVSLGLWNMGGASLTAHVTLTREVPGFQPDGDLQAGKRIPLRGGQNQYFRLGQPGRATAAQRQVLEQVHAALHVRCE